jgi:hypothetical protein
MVTTGTTHRPISAEFLTISHRINGKVMIPHTGLLSTLSDTSGSTLDINDTQLSWLYIPNKTTIKISNARIIKNHIIAACVNRREDLGSLPLGAYTVCQPYRVCMITSQFELEATLEWPGWFDFSVLMGKNIGEFIPIYQVIFNVILAPKVIIKSPAALINRRFIELMTFANRENIQAG